MKTDKRIPWHPELSQIIDQLTIRSETAEEGNKERDEKIRELEERVKLLEVFGDE